MNNKHQFLHYPEHLLFKADTNLINIGLKFTKWSELDRYVFMGRISDKSLIQILSVIVFKDLQPKKMRRNRTEKVLEKIGKLRSRVRKCLNLHDVIYQQPIDLVRRCLVAHTHPTCTVGIQLSNMSGNRMAIRSWVTEWSVIRQKVNNWTVCLVTWSFR